jgi:hypothetical protein
MYSQRDPHMPLVAKKKKGEVTYYLIRLEAQVHQRSYSSLSGLILKAQQKQVILLYVSASGVTFHVLCLFHIGFKFI